VRGHPDHSRLTITEAYTAIPRRLRVSSLISEALLTCPVSTMCTPRPRRSVSATKHRDTVKSRWRNLPANAERRDPRLPSGWGRTRSGFPEFDGRPHPNPHPGNATLEMAADVLRDFGVTRPWPVVGRADSAPWVLEDDFR